MELSPPLPCPSASRRSASTNLPLIQATSFPHFRHFIRANGDGVELEYVKQLVPEHPEKAVFQALARTNGKTSTVVVKFTPKYCHAAHEIAQAKNFAPVLWFYEEVHTVGMFVVVMDFIEGESLGEDSALSEELVRELREVLGALHGHNLVYGDLRPPNVIISDHGPMLVDFDWAGEEGTARYPADINMGVLWHRDVKPCGLIHRDHDIHMLDCWKRGGSDS